MKDAAEFEEVFLQPGCRLRFLPNATNGFPFEIALFNDARKGLVLPDGVRTVKPEQGGGMTYLYKGNQVLGVIQNFRETRPGDSYAIKSFCGPIKYEE